jgi:hypothetical protein
VNPVVESLLTGALEIVGGGGAGYVLALFKVDRAFAKATTGLRRDTAKQFEELEEALKRGLRLELAMVQQAAKSEIARLQDRVIELRKMAEDLRDRSGDYTQEAELAQFVGRVGEWMERTNLAVGRIQGLLGVAKEVSTIRPPKPAEPPRYPPHFPSKPPRRPR